MMKKKMLAALTAACLLAAVTAAADVEITVHKTEDGACALAQFVIVSQETADDGENDAQAAMETALADRLETRFDQSRAETCFKMAQLTHRTEEMRIHQTARIFETDDVCSLALLWRGEQADGRDGSAYRTMTLDKRTGEEIALNSLFTDAEAAFALMEDIIAADVLESMSDYVETAALLPMPRDCWSMDETGITVYWQEDAYRMLDGLAGSVHFAWTERGLNMLIAPESCAYALANAADDVSMAERARAGMLDGRTGLRLGDTLGEMARTRRLATEADNTRTSKVFFFEEASLRGWSAEIPKYTETGDWETPVTAIRSARISAFGLTTGISQTQDALTLLGEPAEKKTYAEDGYDWMLEPAYGESWFYQAEGCVVQLHFDRTGTLAMMILRTTMPEMLY